jgi:hypothetical protein
MPSLGGRGLSPGWRRSGRLKRRLRLSLKHVQHEAIEHELVGIHLLRATAIDTPEELLHLVFEHLYLALG